MEVHEAANIFPMEEETIAELAADIAKRGLSVPIERWGGKLLDGRRRLRACQIAGVSPRFRDLDQAAIPDPVGYVLSLNLHRRHLTTSQRAMVGARAREIYDREARERVKTHGGTAPGRKASPVANSPQVMVRGAARELVGNAVGVGGKSIDAATKVLRQGTPELIAAVDAGEITTHKAVRIIDNPDPEAEKVPAHPKPAPIGVGIDRAADAIAALKRIPPDDPLRRDGYKMVANFIKHNL